MLPKRRFWKEEQKMKSGFSKHFSTVRGPNWVLTPLESTRKSGFHLLFILPTSSFGRGKFMLPKRRFWTTEPTFQNAFSKHFSTFCSQNRVRTTLKSASKTLSLPNEDLGRRNKRWNVDFRSPFQGREYSIWATNHWKGLRKIRISSFVPPSQIFVWGA